MLIEQVSRGRNHAVARPFAFWRFQMTKITDDVTTVPMIDLERYLGTWFEICRLPLKWEDAEACDITATYSLQSNGKVRVDNRCFDRVGKPDQAIGEAVPVDASNAKLKVSFLPQFLRWIPFTKGDYWILRISPEYDVALVGTPTRENLWLLARNPQLSPEVTVDFLATAEQKGFDLSALIIPVQSGKRVENSAFD